MTLIAITVAVGGGRELDRAGLSALIASLPGLQVTDDHLHDSKWNGGLLQMLGVTLRRIAEQGPSAFYEGEVAEARGARPHWLGSIGVDDVVRLRVAARQVRISDELDEGAGRMRRLREDRGA